MQLKDNLADRDAQIFVVGSPDVQGPLMGLKFVGLFPKVQCHASIENRQRRRCFR